MNKEEEQTKVLTPEELHDKIAATMVVEARTKPWSYSWRYMVGHAMLQQPKVSIKHVKNTLGLTYNWMLETGLIRYNKYKQLEVNK